MTVMPVLIDFDGIIRIEDKIADDAELFLRFLDKNKIPFFIISNSTQYTGNDIKKILASSGIEININAMTTIDATINYLTTAKMKINIYCKEQMRVYFRNFITEGNPDAVVIGDLEEGWTYDILNEIFRIVYNGAGIIAMQKNKFWKPGGKDLSLDAGAFINAIEYAASKEALVIGKPSPIYFNAALRGLGFPEGSGFLMIGDDINTDILGAQNIGGTGILIFTGKTKKGYKKSVTPKALYECENLADVIPLITELFSYK